MALRLSLRNIRVAQSLSATLLKSGNRQVSSNPPEVPTDQKSGSYAAAYKKFEDLNKPSVKAPETFASLLKNSKFIDVSCQLVKLA